MGNLKNLATGTVLTAPSPATSGTSLVLQSGEGARMPATPFYAIAHPDGALPTLDNAEIISVTNVSTDTLTITRAQLSTTAKSIAVTWRISNPFLKEDYDAKQDLDATLTALAAFNSNGSLHQTAADTFVARTLTAGSSKLSVSNGNGVSGNPTVDVVPGNIDPTTLSLNALARANHTGTQTASTISDFDTQVRTSRLDQMAAPTASVSMNSQRITTQADPTSAQDSATKNYVDAGLMRNALYNGTMEIWQRNTTFTYTDDTFGPDRWNLLTETNGAWTCARSTDAPSGFTYSAKFTNVTANNQAGIVQILEFNDAKRFQDTTVSISFYAKTTTSKVISNLRAAVLSWTGTADTVTSDVIGTWAQDGTNPTWATSYTAENTATNNALTTSWQRFTINNIAVDTASMNNLALVIWVDDGTITAADEFYITGIQLNGGNVSVPFQYRPFPEELANCMRYYEKSYDYTSPPGTNTDLDHGIFDFGISGGGAAFVSFKVSKRIAAFTGQTYDPAGNAGSIGTEGSNNLQTRNFDNFGTQGFKVFKGAVSRVSFHWTADAEL